MGDNEQQTSAPEHSGDQRSSFAAPNSVKIEKGIPLPRGLSGRAFHYPWNTMDVGDSFEVPPEVQKHFHCQASQMGRKTGRKFAVRKYGTGRRCWRVS